MPETPWSVCYNGEGGIARPMLIGPFGSKEEALAAAQKAQDDNEYDIRFQHVFMLSPTHELFELDIELGKVVVRN